MRQNLLDACENRLSKHSEDSWALEIKCKLSECFDLVSVGARYHKSCKATFQNGKNIKRKVNFSPALNPKKREGFENACRWLESEKQTQSMSKFCDKVKECSASGETYVKRHVKDLLETRYGDSILICSLFTGTRKRRYDKIQG